MLSYCLFHWLARSRPLKQTCILIDDSASMHHLWHEAEAALAGIVDRVINYDADGLDVYFLNSRESLQGVKHSGTIRELFQYVGPVGDSTPTEVRVSALPLLTSSNEVD